MSDDGVDPVTGEENNTDASRCFLIAVTIVVEPAAGMIQQPGARPTYLSVDLVTDSPVLNALGWKHLQGQLRQKYAPASIHLISATPLGEIVCPPREVREEMSMEKQIGTLARGHNEGVH